MPSDSFNDVTKRDWAGGLPDADPGNGRPWFNAALGVPMIGDTVLVASKAEASTIATGLLTSHSSAVQHGTTATEQTILAGMGSHITDTNDPHQTLPVGGVYSQAEVDAAIAAAVDAATLIEIDGGGA